MENSKTFIESVCHDCKYSRITRGIANDILIYCRWFRVPHTPKRSCKRFEAD